MIGSYWLAPVGVNRPVGVTDGRSVECSEFVEGYFFGRVVDRLTTNGVRGDELPTKEESTSPREI